MEHLLTADNWKEYTRVSSIHLDSAEVEVFIDECEQLFIIPGIGADIFLKLVGEELDERQKLLLEGGEYIDKGQKKHVFKGIRHTLAYFVYVRMTVLCFQEQDFYNLRMNMLHVWMIKTG